MKLVLINPPPNYKKLLGPVPAKVQFTTLPGTHPAFIHLFCRESADLKKQLSDLRRRLADNGMLWISWPKKSAGVTTDVTEDAIRRLALPMGFVDVKVCAVDDTWSGLKLVIRRVNRKGAKIPK